MHTRTCRYVTIFLDRCHRNVKLYQQKLIRGASPAGGGEGLWMIASLFYAVALAYAGANCCANPRPIINPVVEAHDRTIVCAYDRTIVATVAFPDGATKPFTFTDSYADSLAATESTSNKHRHCSLVHLLRLNDRFGPHRSAAEFAEKYNRAQAWFPLGNQKLFSDIIRRSPRSASYDSSTSKRYFERVF